MAPSLPTPVLSLLSRAYGALMIAYPTAHRQAYGSLMVQLFRDLGQDEYRQHGALGLAGFCLHTLFDMGISAAIEHLEKGRAVMQSILETQGLVPALEDFVKQLAETASCEVHLKAEQLPRLSKQADSTILGLIKEAASNAKAHAAAANLWITICQRKDVLEVSVRDDGQGFDLDKVVAEYKARGRDPMGDMRSRVEAIQGDLSIQSTVGVGTTLRITAPLSRNLAPST